MDAGHPRSAWVRADRLKPPSWGRVAKEERDEDREDDASQKIQLIPSGLVSAQDFSAGGTAVSNETWRA